MRPDASVVQLIHFMKNTISLNDAILGLPGSEVDDYFYQLSEKESFISDPERGPGPGIYFQQQYKLDVYQDQYSR